MNFPSDIEDKLGFTEIRNLLNKGCRSLAGKQIVSKLKFSSNYKVVDIWLSQTGEFQSLINSGQTPAITEIDIQSNLDKLAEKHSVLQANELVDLRLVSSEMLDLITFFSSKSTSHPQLSKLLDNINDPTLLISEISMAFDDFGEWRRDASRKLQGLLDEIDANQREAYSIIKRIYNQAADKKWTAETEVTVKDGRLVIPIFAEHKRKVKGIMHDESGAGKILYIEPIEVLEASNRQKELEMERDREMLRILKQLTKQARLHLSDLKLFAMQMGIFDFIRSKASLATKLNASLPVVTKSSDCKVTEMYHPLLLLTNNTKKKETMPMDIALSDEHRIIVISGPNAGGKSVTIKTLALNQYMLQCGVLPCADPKSEFGFFKHLFVDIGDNQSIENDLSSYSSHLTAMKHFLAKSTPSTLLVIDEIGSGTDPNFGGAMAEAILIHLNKKKPRGAVTTHFGNVKSLAKSEEGFINASMLYDTKLLKPLYKFEIGKPGSSFALEVAQNIGLPDFIIKQARKRSNIKQQRTDELLATLENERKELKERIEEIANTEAHLSRLKNDYELLKKELSESKTEILSDAKQTAHSLIENANAEIERTIKSIKESGADKNKTKRARTSLERKKEKLTGKQVENKVEKRSEAKAPIEVGSEVKIPNSSSVGEVIQIRKNKAVVAAGIIKSTYEIADLVAVKTKQKKAKSKVDVGFMKRQEQFAMEKDVRGMRADEALKEIDRWIDDAIIIGANNLRLIHGKGDGILKKIIRDYYHNKSFVKRITYEDVRMGGEGVSLIELS
ncbi:MAG: Smr/MutS family protein [Bacteroidetes bacterium]|nr:Smr/MutS family protein [Bacteroidota bacterium]